MHQGMHHNIPLNSNTIPVNLTRWGQPTQPSYLSYFSLSPHPPHPLPPPLSLPSSSQQAKPDNCSTQPVLCGLHNLISSGTHSSVVQGHVEFLRVFLEGRL